LTDSNLECAQPERLHLAGVRGGCRSGSARGEGRKDRFILLSRQLLDIYGIGGSIQKSVVAGVPGRIHDLWPTAARPFRAKGSS
jgi:hypothetical protein